jgi:hypothetical protein
MDLFSKKSSKLLLGRKGNTFCIFYKQADKKGSKVIGVLLNMILQVCQKASV